MIKNKNT